MNPVTRLAGGVATAVALFALASPAVAGGSIKDTPEPRRCTLSANVALTTDYVFRGFSQTREGPAVQGGFDATCGMFYAGIWASALDWSTSTVVDAHLETDYYAGVKFNTGKIAWDLGVIYYAYPNAQKFVGLDANYLELKIGASAEVWKGGTLGATVFYSPDYQYETGDVWTVEGSYSQVLPSIGKITPTFSALIGYQSAVSDKLAYIANVTGDDSKYMYWNAGVTFAFDKNWSLDIRYWDTDVKSVPGGCSTVDLFNCEERVVGTLKFTY